MITDVKNFTSLYCLADAPVLYKNVELYPILVKDYPTFSLCYDILCTEKNQINDLNVIQMNYLDFIFDYLMTNTTPIEENSEHTIGEIYRDKLICVLSLCLHDGHTISQYKKHNHNILMIDDIEINAQSFDEMRKIILYQNIIDYSDEYISPDVQKAVADYYVIKNKGIVSPTLEEQIAYFTAMTGILKKDVLNMTYREFDLVFNAAKDKLDYQINKTAELSGMVTFKKPIEHWIYKTKKNKFTDAFASYDELKNKIQ